MMRSTLNLNDFSLFGRDYGTTPLTLLTPVNSGQKVQNGHTSQYALQACVDLATVSSSFVAFKFQLLLSWTSSAAIWNYEHIFAGECHRKPDSDLANCVQYYWYLCDSANLDFVSVSTYCCAFFFHDRSWLFLYRQGSRGYYKDGMRVPDYVMLLFADDKYVEVLDLKLLYWLLFRM